MDGTPVIRPLTLTAGAWTYPVFLELRQPLADSFALEHAERRQIRLTLKTWQ